MTINVTFEEAMSELEEIVLKLENGNLSLDESIELFQRGIELSKICSKKLDDAERKITILTQNKDGSFDETPFLDEGE